jgi:nitrate/nitrite transporter NarK
MTVVVAGVVGTIRSYGIGLFAAPVIGKISDHAKSYSRACIVLLLCEIVFTGVLHATPGNPSYVMVCVVAVLAFATVMYALRGVYYATMGEAGVPLGMTATATGIISVIGYLPDTFMNLLIGDKLDKYPGAAGYKYIFIYMIVFAVLGICVALIINRVGKKRAAAEAGSEA